MHNTVCLVTGGNSGIGRETAVGLAKAGATVVIVARDRGRGEEALADIRARSGGNTSLMLADLSSQAEIRRFASEFAGTHPRLDVLVNNAGAVFGERLLSVDGIEMTLALNHLGYFLVTHELLGLLRASAPARIVNVASDAHRSAEIRLDDLQFSQGANDYGGFRVYAHSKLANVMFTYELARRIEGSGVTVNALHPGVVATNFGNSGGALLRFVVRLARPFFISAAKGATTPIYLASSPAVEGVSGKYFVNKREVPSSPSSYDEAAQRRLWEASERLTGVG